VVLADLPTPDTTTLHLPPALDLPTPDLDHLPTLGTTAPQAALDRAISAVMLLSVPALALVLLVSSLVTTTSLPVSAHPTLVTTTTPAPVLALPTLDMVAALEVVSKMLSRVPLVAGTLVNRTPLT